MSFSHAAQLKDGGLVTTPIRLLVWASSSTFALSANATPVALDNPDTYDPLDLHDPVTNNSRVFVPSAGTYMVEVTGTLTIGDAPLGGMQYFGINYWDADGTHAGSSPNSANCYLFAPEKGQKAYLRARTQRLALSADQYFTIGGHTNEYRIGADTGTKTISFTFRLFQIGE